MSRIPRITSLSSLLSVLFLLVLFGPIDGNAQPSNLNIGDRVRITAPSPNGIRLVGTVVDYSSSVILVKTKQSEFSVPLDVVSKFEVSKGRKRRTGRGLAWGSILGMIPGGLLFSPKKEDTVCTTDQGLCGMDFEWLEGMMYGSLAGMVVGAIVGSTIKTDRWEERPLNLSMKLYRSGRTSIAVNPAISLTIPLNRKKPH